MGEEGVGFGEREGVIGMYGDDGGGTVRGMVKEG